MGNDAMVEHHMHAAKPLCLGTALQENKPLIGFAMFSGFCIYFGNLAEQYALALAGVTIAVPVFSSCIVVLGAHIPPFCSGLLPHACRVCHALV